MTSMHTFKNATFCVLLLSAVMFFDYFTGYEVSSYPAYLMPIFLAVFYFGRTGGYVACVVAVLAWAFIDYLNGHTYSHEALLLWNALSRFGVYLIFVYGLSLYTKTVEVHRQRLAEMRRLMFMCHGCGKVLWKDGRWISPEEAFELTDAESPECPDCAAQAQRS
jgi:hypothetical protein